MIKPDYIDQILFECHKRDAMITCLVNTLTALLAGVVTVLFLFFRFFRFVVSFNITMHF